MKIHKNISKGLYIKAFSQIMATMKLQVHKLSSKLLEPENLGD